MRAAERVAQRLPERVAERVVERLEKVEFREVPLEEAITLFSEQTGINVVASPEARKTLVSLYLRNVTPDDALDALCKSNGLWQRRDQQSNIVRIYTTKEFQSDLASFREEQTEVFTLLYPNPVDVAAAIRSVYGNRVVMNLQPQWQDAYQDLQERFDRFDIVDGRSQGLGLFDSGSGTGNNSAGSALGGIGGGAGISGRGGQSSGGGMYRRQDLLNDSRAARDSAKTKEIAPLEEFKNLSPEEIELLEANKQGEGKINRETLEALLARRQATIYVTVIRQHNQLIVRTSDEKTMTQIKELVRRVDTPTPLVLLEIKILQINMTDDFTSIFDYQFASGGAAGGFTTGNILPPLSDNPALIPPPRTRRDSILTPEDLVSSSTGLPNRPLTFQYVSDNFRFRMQLLENNNRVTTLASPLILTANNEVSRLFVGQEVPLNRNFTGPTPLVSATGVATPYAAGSTAIEFRPVGVSLYVTPNINADRTVTLRILQEISDANSQSSVLVPTNAGFSPQQVNVVTSRTVSGTVVGMDGLTVAVGGLIRDSVQDNRAEVPILGKLPVIGFLFRQQESTRHRDELVILIRPYVFSTPAESAAASADRVQDLSIHPMRCDPSGTMNTFLPHEVLRPNPPLDQCQKIFRFHSLEPKRF